MCTSPASVSFPLKNAGVKFTVWSKILKWFRKPYCMILSQLRRGLAGFYYFRDFSLY